jgi:hypothetical protein
MYNMEFKKKLHLRGWPAWSRGRAVKVKIVTFFYVNVHRYRNSGGDRWVRRDRERDGDRDSYKGSSGGRYRESNKKEDR